MNHLALASTDERLLQRLTHTLDSVASVNMVPPDIPGVTRDVARLKPSLLLIDVGPETGVEGPVREMVDAIRLVDPRLEVLVLGDARDPSAVLQAIRAGSVDFFDRNDDLDSVRVHLIGRQAAMAAEVRAEPGAFTLVLSGQPGNGESMVAVNLALLRAREAGEGLLIDCNLPSSEAGPALDVRPGYTMYDAVRDLDRLDRTFVQSALSRYEPLNLHIMPLSSNADREEALSPENFLTALGTIRSLFRETVLNAGGLRHGPLLGTICQSATDIFLVCQQKYTALRDCKSLLAGLPGDRALRRRITLVVDEYDPAINLDETQMRETLGLERSCRLPSARAALLNGLNLGRPFVLEETRSPYVAALEALAFPDAAPAPRPKGLFGMRTMLANLAGAK
jgi:pilus assembly protein CpaE